MTFFLDSSRTSPIALRIINPKDFLTTHFDRKVEVWKIVLNLGTLPFNKMIYSIFNLNCHYQHINISKILKQNVYFLTYTFNFVILHFSFCAICTPLVLDWPPIVQVLEVPCAFWIACVQDCVTRFRSNFSVEISKIYFRQIFKRRGNLFNVFDSYTRNLKDHIINVKHCMFSMFCTFSLTYQCLECDHL